MLCAIQGWPNTLAVAVLERDARAGVGAVADAERRLVLRQLLHLDDHRRRLRRAGRRRARPMRLRTGRASAAAPGSRAAACSLYGVPGQKVASAAHRALVVAAASLRSGSAPSVKQRPAVDVPDRAPRCCSVASMRALRRLPCRASGSRRRAGRRASRSWRRSRPAGGTARRARSGQSRAACPSRSRPGLLARRRARRERLGRRRARRCGRRRAARERPCTVEPRQARGAVAAASIFTVGVEVALGLEQRARLRRRGARPAGRARPA